MKPSDRLLARLREECHLRIPGHAVIRRTRAGRHMKAAGAWTWFVWVETNLGSEFLNIGGLETVTKLSRCRRISVWTNEWGETEVASEDGMKQEAI